MESERFLSLESSKTPNCLYKSPLPYIWDGDCTTREAKGDTRHVHCCRATRDLQNMGSPPELLQGIPFRRGTVLYATSPFALVAQRLRFHNPWQNREVLNENATINKDFIRKLAKTADVCEELLMEHQKQYGSWQDLINKCEAVLAGHLPSVRSSDMRNALAELWRRGQKISDDLVVKNDKLIERVIRLLVLHARRLSFLCARHIT